MLVERRSAASFQYRAERRLHLKTRRRRAVAFAPFEPSHPDALRPRLRKLYKRANVVDLLCRTSRARVHVHSRPRLFRVCTATRTRRRCSLCRRRRSRRVNRGDSSRLVETIDGGARQGIKLVVVIRHVVFRALILVVVKPRERCQRRRCCTHLCSPSSNELLRSRARRQLDEREEVRLIERDDRRDQN